MKPVRKAVFPVGGMGTRFLPATKASPKEMLPVVDKPLIQYAVEEALEAGIEDMIFITGRGKRAIADHFDKAWELETSLEAKGKDKLLELVRDTVPNGVNCIFIRQPEALGLGHAVAMARPVVGDEPFAVLLADDLIDGQNTGVIQQMLEVYETYHSSVLGVMQVPMSEIYKYGSADVSQVKDGVWDIQRLVEKPPVEEATSDIAVVGRYILTPTVFDALENTGKGAGGEYQLTDAISALLDSEKVYAHAFAGKRYDCGSKIGYLQANVEYGLKHEDTGEAFQKYLRELMG